MGSRARAALLLAVITSFALASGFVAAQEAGEGEDELSGPTQMTIEVRMGPEGSGFTIHPAEMTVAPGTEVTFHVVNVGSSAHDFTFLSQDFQYNESDLREREDGGEAVKTPLLEAGEEYNLTVTFGEDYSGEITYICSVPGHRGAGMEGTLAIGAAGGGEGERSIEDFGVHYLAYWVGIVSFVILFIVLFATFFFLRYGESKHVTDHRTGGPETITVAAGSAEGEGREMVEPVLPSPGRVAQVLIALALIGLGIYFLLPLL